ncbi:MAG: amidohydrolase family protein [Alphaproteobacteria bacterium]
MAIATANALILADAFAAPRAGAILVSGDRISGLAHGDEVPGLLAHATEIHDARGAIALPGFVNAHHHAYANVLRGAENDLPLERWSFFTVAWGRALDAELLRIAILLGAAEMLRAGTTAVLDHAPGLALRMASVAAHRESGMRVGFAPMLHDRHDHELMGFALPDGLRARIEGNGFPSLAAQEAALEELASDLHGDPRVRLLVAPNAPQRCSPALLDLCATLRARLGLPFHAHLLETRAQAVLCRRLWPRGVVAELDRRGLLAADASLAHCVWAEDAEFDLVARRDAVVVHNPASNLMLGSGIMPLGACMSRGIATALGSDSANTGGRADPFELMRLATMLPRIDPRVRRFPGDREALAMATSGGAAALGLRQELGRLAPGQLADIVLVALDDGAGATALPGPEVLVRHASPVDVQATMVAGAWAFRDGRILAFDEEAVRAGFRARAAAFVERAAPGRQAAREAADLVAPVLDAFAAGRAC